MSKPDTYKNSNASQTVPVSKVRTPVVGRYVEDPTAPYGVRFVESKNTDQ